MANPGIQSGLDLLQGKLSTFSKVQTVPGTGIWHHAHNLSFAGAISCISPGPAAPNPSRFKSNGMVYLYQINDHFKDTTTGLKTDSAETGTFMMKPFQQALELQGPR